MPIFIKQELIQKNLGGYMNLISVLVVGAVCLGATLSIILLGLGSSRSSFVVEQSNQAKAMANACAEEALQQIRDLTTFTGGGNLAFGQGSCTYNVTNQGGANRTVQATGTVDTVVRKVSVSITAINPLLVVSSWQEVP